MTPNALRAIAHPLRLQILSLLTSSELSAAEVGRELDTSQANASYHLRVLASAGLLVPAGQEQIRGGIAKRYRHPWRREDQPGARTSPATTQVDHRTLIHALAQELVRRSEHWREGTNHVVDAELWVDPDVWKQCVELVDEASALLHEAAQPPRSPGTVKATMSSALFLMSVPVSGTKG